MRRLRYVHAPAILQPTKTKDDIRPKTNERPCRDVLQRTAGVPIRLLKLLKARAEMIAPAFPLAAEIP